MRLKLLYLLRNLLRNPRRSLLTCAAVGLPVMIYVLSMSVVDGVERFLDNSMTQLRLAVTQKTSIINPLPAGYRKKIAALDPSSQRIIAVCGMSWIGGRIEGDPRPLSTLAVDRDAFISAFPEFQLSEDEQAAWMRDRRAIILGRSTARQFGWQVGDRITLIPSLPPYSPMEFHVISTAEKATDPSTNWCHHAYWDEIKKQSGYPAEIVGFLFIKCATRQDMDYYRVAIDDFFANYSDATKTQDEKAFMNEFITQQFNLPRNLSILSAVTVFVAIMAAGNTMSMNFRDRFSELATMKALGFGRWTLFSQVQGESLLLCLLGGAVGAFVPYWAFNYSPLRNFTVPLIQQLEVTMVVCLQALLISAGVGVIAAAWPAIQAWRLSVVTALRNQE